MENKMPIKRNELDEMNEALKNGRTIAQLSKKYPEYDYWEIYWEVNDASFLGKKRTVTNRINKLVKTKTLAERELIAEEAQELLNELYNHLKANSKKLIEIDRVLRK
jgi:(p)ppGpp synthase/HD superfamily hydrolase